MNNIRSESFDIFICSHVLEHVPDDKKALSELFRILRPGGFGILMVPIALKMSKVNEDPSIEDVGERWRRFGQDDHVRQYSKSGFIERVKGAGFIINQYSIDFFGEDVFRKYGISPKSILYVVERKRKKLRFISHS
jgi:ubiquinone/menaquinone biosynthesis C-methylase UbiE